MEFSDIYEKKQGKTNRNSDEYENIRIGNAYVIPASDLNETNFQTTEGFYEKLRLELKRNSDKHVKEENKTDTMRWKDLPNQIKCIIYTLSMMLVILYIVFITAVVVIVLSKGEFDGTWTQWSAWSNCDVTCGNGTQTRLRLCYNPLVPTVQLDCNGISTESRRCQHNICPRKPKHVEVDVRRSLGPGLECASPNLHIPERCNNTDYGVAFTAYNLNTTENSNTVFKFQNFNLNKGDGYNSTTGVFTCRIPGVYHFAITLTKMHSGKTSVHVILLIRESTRLNLHYSPKGNGSDEVGSSILTGSGTYHLNINDTVKVFGVPSYFFTGYFSAFTGFLISPDV